MSAQLIFPIVLLPAVTTGVNVILLVNRLDVAHQEILRLEESMAAKTLVPRTVHHLNQMFVNMNFVLMVSLIVFHITDAADVHFVHTLRMRMIGEMFPHGFHGPKVDFPADLTGERVATLSSSCFLLSGLLCLLTGAQQTVQSLKGRHFRTN